LNLIVIVADSLRVDHLGAYGSSVKTPNIDRLAGEGALFENAYAENLPTMPCRTAWWTGQFLFPSRGWQPLEVDDVLLAEVLWSRGYRSALVTDTYHMHKPGYNCGRGFDSTLFVRGQEYDPWVLEGDVDLEEFHRLRGDESDAMWRGRFEQYLRNRTRFTSEEEHCAPRVFTRAMRWLEDASQRQRDNLFLWIDSFSPHEPWDPPSPFREMYDPDYDGQELIDPVPGPVQGYMSPEELAHTRALYAGCVSLVDKWVGIFLDRLRDLGLYDNSLIMFTSDHGEPFGEHDVVRKAGALRYDYLAHIPWIVRHPQGLGAGKRFEDFVQPPDLMPTVLEALGAEHDLKFGGRSLLPILSGQRESLRDFAITGWFERGSAIRTEDWTCFLDHGADEPCELYSRRDDPAEKHNLAGECPDVCAELGARLKDFAKEASAPQD